MNTSRAQRRLHPLHAATVLLVSGLLVLIASCQKRGDGPGEIMTSLQNVGGLRIGVTNTPNPPQVGDNALTVVVRDAAGQPVHGAQVEVRVSMAAMGAMPRMESRGKVREDRPGMYRAEYGLAMNGEWDVAVRARPRNGTAVEAAFRLSTSTSAVTFEGGTPAAGSGQPAPSGSATTEAPGTVRIDAARRQQIGVRTAPVEIRNLSTVVRAAGRVSYDEKRETEVSLKLSGWVRDLRVDFTGRAVRAGEVLFTAYSPELWSAQQEFLEALHAQGDSARAARGEPTTELAMAARQRLLLWDITPAQIESIARAGRPREALPIVSPASGVVTEKNVVRGSAFTAGQVLYKIAPLDPVWVVAAIHEVDLPLMRVGLTATLTNPYLDGRSRQGRVSFVGPALQTDTRTGEVRIEVSNPRGELKPGMFVNAELAIPLGRRLAVPESAVLPTGERRVVFVDLGDGRLAPREVRLGAAAGDYYEVLSGLRPGEAVVTSGNFLVAAESKLKSATQKW